MSHFAVFVIGEDVEKQLQPFHEYECTGVDDEYVKFVEAEESEEDLRKDFLEHNDKAELPGDKYDSFEHFLNDFHGYEIVDGKIGKYTNPNSKWDWWVFGGRWKDHLLLKDGSAADQAKFCEIDFDSMRSRAENNARERYREVLNACGGTIPKIEKSWEQVRKECNDDIEKARLIYQEQEGAEKLSKALRESRLFFLDANDFQCSEEEYVKIHRTTMVPAFAILKDGKWHERGKMLFFAIVKDEKKKAKWAEEFWRVVNSCKPNDLVTVVDCHI